MVKRVEGFNFVKFKSLALFGFLFYLIFGYVVRSVDALVYLGQSYSGGWGVGGFYYNDLVSFYYAYPGWIDFIAFFMIFTSLGKLVFGERFKNGGNAGKALSFALGLTLSLGLVLWQARNGINLLEHSAILTFILLTLGIVGGVYYLLAKKWNVGGGIALGIGLLIAYLVWMALASYTGLGIGNLFRYMGGGFGGYGWHFGGIVNLVLSIIGVILLLKLIGSIVGWSKGSSDGLISSDGGNKPPGKFWRGARKLGEGVSKLTGKGLLGAARGGWKGMKAAGRGARRAYADFRQSAKSYVNQIIEEKRKCMEIIKDVNARIAGLANDMRDYMDSEEGKIIHRELEDVANFFTGILRSLSSPKITLTDLTHVESQYAQGNKKLQRILRDLKGIKQLKGLCKSLKKTSNNGESHFNNLGNLADSLIIIAGSGDLTLDQVLELIEQNKKDSARADAEEAAEESIVKTETPNNIGFENAGPQTPPNAVGAREVVGQSSRQTPSPGTSGRLLESPERKLLGSGNRLSQEEKKNVEKTTSALDDIIGNGISIPQRTSFVRGKKIRQLNVAQFASEIVFSKDSKLRRDIVNKVPVAIKQLDSIVAHLNKTNYSSINGKVYEDFVRQYAEIKKYERHVEQFVSGIRSNKLQSYAKTAYDEFKDIPEVSQPYFEKFGQKITNGDGGVVFSNPERLAFIFENVDGSVKLKRLYDYFDRYYGALIYLDAKFREIKRVITQIRKDYNQTR